MARKGCLITAGGIALAVLLILAAVYAIMDPETKTLNPQTRAVLPGEFVNLSDGVTHYTLTGPADGQVVVLVHGFSVASYSWERNIAALNQAGFRVLVYDLYGRGYSDRPPGAYGLDRFTRQLNDLLTALAIKQPVDIAGISLGGYITAAFANRYPQHVKRITLLAPQVESMGSDPRLAPVIAPGFGDFLFTVYIGPYVMVDSPDEFKDYMPSSDWHDRYLDMMAYRGFRRALIATLRDMPGDPYIEYRQLGRSNIPVQLLWGDKDTTVPFVNAALVQKAIPQAQFQVIPGARHASIYERPEVVNPLLIDFFK